MANRQILVEILGNSKGFTTATEEATTSASKFSNVLTGIGQGIGQAGFAAVSQAISGVTDYLTGSLAAAEKDQLSMAQLGQTLKANVPAWDGNQQAIEDYIVSAEKASAFSKDDLRESLQSLVGATKDVTKAENLQTTATNLARYAHVSLSDATGLVIKANEGVYRGLAPLGIKIDSTTDSMTALKRINDLVAGQDTTYLSTEAGQMQTLTNQIDDLQVEIGYKLMPVFEKVLSFINQNFIPAVEKLGQAWDLILSGITAGGSKVSQQYDQYKANIQEGMGELPHVIGKETDDTAVAFGLMVGTIKAGGNDTVHAIAAVSTSVSDGWDALGEKAVTKIEKIGKKIRTVATGAFTTSLDLNPTIVPDSKRLQSLYSQLATVEGNRDRALKAHDTVSVQADNATIAKLTAEINKLVQASDSLYANGGNKMASGGIVKASPGGTNVILAEAGEDEFVIPRSKMGGGTTIININGGMFMDPTSLDKLAALLDGRKRLRQI